MLEVGKKSLSQCLAGLAGEAPSEQLGSGSDL